MGVNTPGEILEIVEHKAVEKAGAKPAKTFVLGILGGMYIALGFLGYVRVTGTMPASFGGFSTFIGACVFPVGLMLVILGGGELITGNMLFFGVGCARGKVKLSQLLMNWLVVTLANLTGAVLVAYFFGHVTGYTEGDFLNKTLAIANAKVDEPFLTAFVSGIGCNILVCGAIWIAFGSKDFIGKIFGMWFPIMVFVVIGFQHVAANMFIIPAAIFSGQSDISWLDFIANAVPVFLGNAAGGGLVIGFVYSVIYGKR